MAVEAVEVPVDPEIEELESTFRDLCDRLPQRRVELVNGRIVVNPVPTGEHNRIVYRLILQLLAVVQERGWEIWNDITIFLGPQQDRYRPDLTVVPAKPKMWAKDHVHGDQTLLVVEVVSAGSMVDDRQVKPVHYAAGGVPLCLVVDPFERKARLLSEPEADGYQHETEVVFGRALDLPEPWRLTLDTSAFSERPPSPNDTASPPARRSIA